MMSANTDSGITTIEALISNEILTYSVFPFLADNPKELVEYMCVSRGFHQAADHPSVWKALAVNRYGGTITHATEEKAIQERKLYASLKEAILKDDNAQMAIPTIREPKACYWKYNNRVPRHYYCCIVQGIKWNRFSDLVHVYLDVRGEMDLRHPRNSRITSGSAAYNAPYESWQSATSCQRGHFKGYLAINASFFSANTDEASYFFEYSAKYHDYEKIELFTLPSSGLKGLFGIGAETPSSFKLKTDDDTIFEKEDVAEERSRWERFVPTAVLDRGRGQPGAWWVD